MCVQTLGDYLCPMYGIINLGIILNVTHYTIYILYYHASSLALQTSLISCALGLPRA